MCLNVFTVFKPNIIIMKKVLFVLVLIMAVITVNAQATQTVTKEKPVRAEVLVADLQKTITDNIAKEYVGYTIKEASSLTLNSIVTYEVVVVKGTATETLLYDKAGLAVKKTLPEPKKE
jgi:uncharacterized protein with ATP-grasp and redox domains